MKIKLLSLLLPLAFSVVSCQSDADKEAQKRIQKAEGMDATKIKFDNKEFDFGETKFMESVEHTYEFTNIGENPLFIADASTMCGCTVPKRPAEPIAPGETGEIVVSYNGSGKGEISKIITISANTVPAQTELIIKGKVLKKEE